MSLDRWDKNRQFEVCLKTVPGVYGLAEVFESCLLFIIMFSGEHLCVWIESLTCCLCLDFFSINIIIHISRLRCFNRCIICCRGSIETSRIEFITYFIFSILKILLLLLIEICAYFQASFINLVQCGRCATWSITSNNIVWRSVWIFIFINLHFGCKYSCKCNIVFILLWCRFFSKTSWALQPYMNETDL